MYRAGLAATGCIAAFVTLPLWGGADQVQAHASQLREGEKKFGCEVPLNSGIQVANLSNSNAQVFVNFGDNGSGGVVSSTVSGPGTQVFEPPNGFEGAAIVSSDQPVAAVVNQLSNGVDSMGSAQNCLPPAFSGLLFPIFNNSQLIHIQNLAGSPTTITNFFYGTDGTQSENSSDTQVPANGTKVVDAKEMGGRNLPKPGTSLAFGEFSDGVSQHTTLPGSGGDDPDDVVSAPPFAMNSDVNYMPLPTGLNYIANIFVQNYFADSGTQPPVKLDFIDDSGSVQQTITGTLQPSGLFQGSATITSDTNIVGVVNQTANSSALLQYEGVSQRNARMTGGGAWPSSGMYDYITKKGLAFGLPSSQKSKVSVVVRNVGDKKAKVKMRVINGDTGKKVQSGKANVGPGETGTVAFKKRARGENLYVEITVKGKTMVVAWLKRDFMGDVDFVRAVPR